MIYIGIDPGTKTGIAVWDTEKQAFLSIRTEKLHEALQVVSDFHCMWRIQVFIEDPNTWKPFRGNKTSNAKIQGAGSIKRDFAIWKEFFEDKKIPYTRIRLQGTMKKIRPDTFQRLSGWSQITSEHARDAAMMVFGMRHGKINIPETVSM
jgi:hypothetical protein